MNVMDALHTLYPAVTDAHIFEQAPREVPKDAYFVVSELTDGQSGPQFYPQSNGRMPQVRTLTLLVTLYGREGWTLAQLRDLFTPLRSRLADLITEHPGLPPIRGATRGPVLPPTPDSGSRRPLAGVRVLLTYVE